MVINIPSWYTPSKTRIRRQSGESRLESKHTKRIHQIDRGSWVFHYREEPEES